MDPWLQTSVLKPSFNGKRGTVMISNTYYSFPCASLRVKSLTCNNLFNT